MRRHLIRDHWYRSPQPDTGCVFRQDGLCGHSRDAHVQAVGEWADTPHWFRPRWIHLPRCARCGRHVLHSTHYLTRWWPRLPGRRHYTAT